jgi:hypothetical protein
VAPFHSSTWSAPSTVGTQPDGTPTLLEAGAPQAGSRATAVVSAQAWVPPPELPPDPVLPEPVLPLPAEDPEPLEPDEVPLLPEQPAMKSAAQPNVSRRHMKGSQESAEPTPRGWA